MLKLHFGEDEATYDYVPKVSPGRKGKAGKPKTTVDVAKRLEAKYNLIGVFFELYEQEIADDLAQGMSDKLDSLLSGGTPFGDPLATVGVKVEERFREFLSSYEAERVGIPGTPTKAALAGVNHRLSKPFAKANPRRPSFIDTALFQENFRAWVEEH